MKLHLTSDCITIHLSETSSHYVHIRHVLTHVMGRSFWVNETLINFDLPEDRKKRKAFLNSLYHTCAFISKTHNASFLQRLLLASERPIKLIKQKNPHTPLKYNDPYFLLNAQETENLESIRRKYLTLAKEFHPDSITSNDACIVKNFTAKFQQIQEAYATIKAEKQKKYAA